MCKLSSTLLSSETSLKSNSKRVFNKTTVQLCDQLPQLMLIYLMTPLRVKM